MTNGQRQGFSLTQHVTKTVLAVVWQLQSSHFAPTELSGTDVFSCLEKEVKQKAIYTKEHDLYLFHYTSIDMIASYIKGTETYVNIIVKNYKVSGFMSKINK